MALMERVATLLRTNLNDLMDRAEDPDKMAKQLLLDMENQLLQVKTQVALALAHQHLLEKKVGEQEAVAAEWHGKAEFAVLKGNDDLARAALARALSHESVLEAFRKQVAEQTAETDALRHTYTTLQGKLTETRAACEVLLAQHRRAHLAAKAAAARHPATGSTPGGSGVGAVSRMQNRIDAAQADNLVSDALGTSKSNKSSESFESFESLEAKFAKLEQDDRVEQLLAELKSRQGHLLPTG